MSDFENGCAGSCDACGSKSDCEKATVTLTLDDGSMMECAILTIFEADEKEKSLPSVPSYLSDKNRMTHQKEEECLFSQKRLNIKTINFQSF